jgi:hypothetical protein
VRIGRPLLVDILDSPKKDKLLCAGGPDVLADNRSRADPSGPDRVCSLLRSSDNALAP